MLDSKMSSISQVEIPKNRYSIRMYSASMLLPLMIILNRFTESNVIALQQQARLLTHSWQWYQVTSGMQDPAFDWNRPDWTQRCHLMLFNGTHLPPELQKVAIANKNLNDYFSAIPESTLGRRRRKRAIQSEASTTKGHDRIVYKTGGHKWDVKKTSFSQAKPIKSSSDPGSGFPIKRRPAKSRYIAQVPFFLLPNEISPLSFQNSQFVSPTEVRATGTSAGTTGPEQLGLGRTIHRAQQTDSATSLDALVRMVSDLKLNQDIFKANLEIVVHRIGELRKFLSYMLEELRMRVVNEGWELRNATWVPRLESLKYNSNQFDMREFYSNLSHYVQYFSVNAEQMVYDQLKAPDSSYGGYPSQLRTYLDDLNCDIQFLVNDLDHLENIRIGFGRLNLDKTKLQDDYLKIYNDIEGRIEMLHHRGETLRSPLWDSKAAYAKVEDSVKRGLVYASRDAMPFNWRHPIGDIQRRLSRDISTYEECTEMLKFVTHLVDYLKNKVDYGVEQLKEYRVL